MPSYVGGEPEGSLYVIDAWYASEGPKYVGDSRYARGTALVCWGTDIAVEVSFSVHNMDIVYSLL